MKDFPSALGVELIERSIFFYTTPAIPPPCREEGQRDHDGRDICEAPVTQAYRFTFAVDGEAFILYASVPKPLSAASADH